MLDFRENADECPLGVTQLTRRIKGMLENNFQYVTVLGEVSGVTRPASGHVYLTLKDAGAELKAVIWRSAAARLSHIPHDGEQIVASGSIAVYEARGYYQLSITSLRAAGEGGARAALEALVRKLRGEGLFAEERKKPLPELAWKIGLVTSATGAAVQDMIKVIRKRQPCARIVVSPCMVQGVGAGESIARALALLDRAGGCDVILVGRGGGSAEDLAAFNEEVVARAVAACVTPVISSVGHEIDTSICDLVADCRAATPSEAAEIATRNADRLPGALAYLRERLDRALGERLRDARERLRECRNALRLRHPVNMLHARQQRLDEAVRALARAGREVMVRGRTRLGLLAARLEAISPLAVLGRGYSITRGETGKIVRSAAAVRPGERLTLCLADGEVRATADTVKTS